MKTKIESINKYTVVMELLGKEYSIDFYVLNEVADFIENERNLKGVYRVQIIKLPVEVYTRKTPSNHT